MSSAAPYATIPAIGALPERLRAQVRGAFAAGLRVGCSMIIVVNGVATVGRANVVGRVSVQSAIV